MQLDQKVVWIDQVLAHDSCPDAIQLREFADRLKHKFARLEAIYQELKLLAQDTCQL